jgi:hypothetical protein
MCMRVPSSFQTHFAALTDRPVLGSASSGPRARETWIYNPHTRRCLLETEPECKGLSNCVNKTKA